MNLFKMETEYDKCIRHMDGYHKYCLNLIKEKYFSEKKENDYVLLVVGETEAGKTTFAAQSCLYMNKNFSRKNVVYNSETFFYNVWNMPFKTSIQLDEGILQIFSKDSLTKESKDIIKKFATIRAKQYFFTICIPTLIDVSKDILKRFKGMVYIRKDVKENVDHRFWYWFTRDQTLNMVEKLKKGEKEAPEFYMKSPKLKKGMLRDFLPFREFFKEHKIINVDEDSERKYKYYSALRKKEEEKYNKEILGMHFERNKVWYDLHKSNPKIFTQELIAKACGVTRPCVTIALKKVKSKLFEI